MIGLKLPSDFYDDRYDENIVVDWLTDVFVYKHALSLESWKWSRSKLAVS